MWCYIPNTGRCLGRRQDSRLYMRKVLEHRASVVCAERSGTFGVILIGTDEKIPGASYPIVWVAHSVIDATIKVEHQELKIVCAVKLDRVSRTQLLSLSFESVPSCCVPSVKKKRHTPNYPSSPAPGGADSFPPSVFCVYDLCDMYRCGRTIGHLTVGDFTVTGVPFFLFAFLVSS